MNGTSGWKSGSELISICSLFLEKNSCWVWVQQFEPLKTLSLWNQCSLSQRKSMQHVTFWQKVGRLLTFYKTLSPLVRKNIPKNSSFAPEHLAEDGIKLNSLFLAVHPLYVQFEWNITSRKTHSRHEPPSTVMSTWALHEPPLTVMSIWALHPV